MLYVNVRYVPESGRSLERSATDSIQTYNHKLMDYRLSRCRALVSDIE
jgi:hypothetical protein